MHYCAFLSYSHADARWAEWVHRCLETYRVPARLRLNPGEFGPLPGRLTPIFRDREDLSSAGELGPRIQQALLDSDAMVVVCSPAAARSPWVNEEIRKFKRSGRGQRIYCLIVDGTPNTGDERECFPDALRYDLDADDGARGVPLEPLAADVRPGKDGKSLARLKLVSGLLGVSLDSLRQREAARRHRRMVAVIVLALAVTLSTSFLAVQAIRAQHAAERRQKQAEALVGFMLGDLTDKLSEVSRLDILMAVDDHAMRYFQSLPTDDLTDQSLGQRAKALVKIGNVRLDQGHLPQALQSYRTAASSYRTLADAAPRDIDRQLAYADVLTFIGTTHWYQGDLDRARADFGAAQSVLLQARALAPANPQLLYQLATLDNNIGHVLEGRGDLDAAMRQYQSMAAITAELLRLQPGKKDWLIYLGLAHNNLAKMALLRGDLSTAVAQYADDVLIEKALARRDARDNAQAERLAISSASLGRTQALIGEDAAGIEHLRAALAQLDSLLAIESESSAFLEDRGLYSTQLARLLRLRGDSSGAERLSTQAQTVFVRLVKQDPGNIGWQRALAEAEIERGQQWLRRGSTTSARALAQSALVILEPLLLAQAQDRATVLAAVEARLLLAATTDRTDSATRLRQQALDSIQAQHNGRSDPRLVALQIEALLALGREKDAWAQLPGLRRSGYRDIAFEELLRPHSAPTLAVGANTTP